MNKSDIAVYQLPITYAELKNKKIEPFIIDKSPKIEPGETLYIASGYWKDLSECNVQDTKLNIREHIWDWDNVIRLSGEKCSVKDGASGSPLISKNLKVLGIFNTYSEDVFAAPCSLSNPCQITDDGNTNSFQADVFATNVSSLYLCLNENNVFDPNTVGCPFKK
jgi:hypothetical protein